MSNRAFGFCPHNGESVERTPRCWDGHPVPEASETLHGSARRHRPRPPTEPDASLDMSPRGFALPVAIVGVGRRTGWLRLEGASGFLVWKGNPIRPDADPGARGFPTAG